jgi:hypothetical protein
MRRYPSVDGCPSIASVEAQTVNVAKLPSLLR